MNTETLRRPYDQTCGGRRRPSVARILSPVFRLFGRMTVGGTIELEQITIPVPDLAPALEGFRIVQLSDFHLYPYTHLDHVRTAVAMANALNPDLIVLTGDYVSNLADAIFDLAPLLAELDARHGVFAVLGNHDVWTERAVVLAGLAAAGLPVLHNRGLTLNVDGARLNLAGVDDGWAGAPDLAAALKGLPTAPTVLLAHEPDLIDRFYTDTRVTLQLSGHTHGGQVRLPGRGALVLPYLGCKYDLGLYRVGSTWLYTNRGIGFGSAPIRINCPPEITEVTLTAKESER